MVVIVEGGCGPKDVLVFNWISPLNPCGTSADMVHDKNLRLYVILFSMFVCWGRKKLVVEEKNGMVG